MANVLSTGLAVGAVLLAGVALFAMSAGNLGLAGFCLLSVSLILYRRETRVNPE